MLSEGGAGRVRPRRLAGELPTHTRRTNLHKRVEVNPAAVDGSLVSYRSKTVHETCPDRAANDFTRPEQLNTSTGTKPPKSEWSHLIAWREGGTFASRALLGLETRHRTKKCRLSGGCEKAPSVMY